MGLRVLLLGWPVVVGGLVAPKDLGLRCRPTRATVAVEEAMELSAAERARTTCELNSPAGAALSTMSRSLHMPWTSFVDYVVDAEGSPVFLVRDEAEHWLNLQHESTASIMLGSGAAMPRVTLSGSVSTIQDDALALAYSLAHPYADELLQRDNFRLCRLAPSAVFFVGGFGVHAQWVDPAAYAAAQPDPVAAHAADLAAELNSLRHADDLKVAAKHLLDCPNTDAVAVAAVDSLGLDLRVTIGSKIFEYRVAYRNRPRSPEDAKSEVNKLLQEAWEADQGIAFDGSYATKPRVKQHAQGGA